ncbi:hypothetical protein KKD52_05450 [Myxococcota bacterium]|nr:hypothetical protein [Myxococcota bacterium]MBU1410315.1 hypothetical protein [Myxococcota bacterium]MBU1509785.1 hypothetical protein [Myxococcota bacterium]
MNRHRLNSLFLWSLVAGLLLFSCGKSRSDTVKKSNDSRKDDGTEKHGLKGTPAAGDPVTPGAEPVTKTLVEGSFQCPRLVFDRATGQPIVKMDQYVDFRLEKGQIFTRIHIREATTDLTFEQCRNLKKDGSDFARRFDIECKTFQGLAGAQFSIDAFLVNTYAGISPIIDSSYPKYRSLVEIGKRTGRGTPRRTIVFYVDQKQMMEFLCYP